MVAFYSYLETGSYKFLKSQNHKTMERGQKKKKKACEKLRHSNKK